MSARRNPFEEMERLFERLGRQFEEVSRNWESDGPLGGWSPGEESMSVDLVDEDEAFVATVDLPGYDRDDVEVRVTDHTLRIAAERDEALEEGDERYIRNERRHQSTRRSIRLPEEVDAAGVSARMKNGVLTITIPKLAAEEAHRVEIEGE
jgi:HSP20 family protein